MTLDSTTLSPRTIRSLQELIQINLDSAQGLRTAAQTINEPHLAELFNDLAAQRQRHAEQLQRIVAIDEEPADRGSLLGGAHRWWLKLRGSLTSDNAYQVLAEAERGEDAIKGRYEAVLKELIESPIHQVLVEQYERVRSGHDRVVDLRDAYKS